jgi:hypothetical protein
VGKDISVIVLWDGLSNMAVSVITGDDARGFQEFLPDDLATLFEILVYFHGRG